MEQFGAGELLGFEQVVQVALLTAVGGGLAQACDAAEGASFVLARQGRVENGPRLRQGRGADRWDA